MPSVKSIQEGKSQWAQSKEHILFYWGKAFLFKKTETNDWGFPKLSLSFPGMLLNKSQLTPLPSLFMHCFKLQVRQCKKIMFPSVQKGETRLIWSQIHFILSFCFVLLIYNNNVGLTSENSNSKNTWCDGGKTALNNWKKVQWLI